MSNIKISIFLPVRNGGEYIKECIHSILNQSYDGFELNILENKSSDGTFEWVTSLIDERIKVWPSDSDLSIEDNWARIKNINKLDYVTTIGHDDLFEENFLSSIVNLINEYPKASIYHTGAIYINSEGKKIRDCISVKKIEKASDYLKARFTYNKDVYGTGYVMKSEDYDKVGGIPPFCKLLFADDALWLSLLSISYKVFDSRNLVSIRIHAQSESAAEGVWRYMLEGLDQFENFLRSYILKDEDCKIIFNLYGASFFQRYYRNMLIYAVIEQSQKKQKVDSSIFKIIKNRIDSKFPGSFSIIIKSYSVRIILLLSKPIFRPILLLFWKIYNYKRGV